MSLERFTTLFPLWTLLGSLLALLHPPLFVWFRGPLITIGLGVIMLGMGLGLTPRDFLRVSRQPRAVILGVTAQFLVMPSLAAAIAVLLQLPAPLAVGLILVGCCPGGTASNVVTLIAKGDVALSVVMTSISTVAAVVLTPRLTELLASQYVPVDGWLLLLEQGALLLLACLLLHGGGFLLGFLMARLVGASSQAQRTISIEVGMQNSGLAVVLARTGGFSSPLTALPGAISAVVHCLLGSALAAVWRRSDHAEVLNSSHP